MTKIQFLPIHTNKEKLHCLSQILFNHFKKREAVVITTPSAEVAQYIDQLLWKVPPESFLPHAYTDVSTIEPIVIVTSEMNPNQAKIQFNLSPTIHPHCERFSLIYELDDFTDPEKTSIAKQKKSAYASKGLLFG